MFTIRDILKTLLGVAVAIVALYMGKVFWIYFCLSFGTIVGVWFTAVMLGYIFIVIGLARFKSWAWGMFLTIVVLAIFMEALFLIVGGPLGNPIEWLFHSIFWISLVAIPVFGISALVRRLRRR